MHIRDEFFVITILTSICLPFFSFFHLIWCLVPYAISIFPLFKQNEIFSGVFTFVYIYVYYMWVNSGFCYGTHHTKNNDFDHKLCNLWFEFFVFRSSQYYSLAEPKHTALCVCLPGKMEMACGCC